MIKESNLGLCFLKNLYIVLNNSFVCTKYKNNEGKKLNTSIRNIFYSCWSCLIRELILFLQNNHVVKFNYFENKYYQIIQFIMFGRNKDKLENGLKKEHVLFKALGIPFKMCNKHILQFFIWSMFVLLAGQLGTIINIVQRAIFNDWTVYQSICADSVSGNFYTYSLALISSVLAPTFSKFIVNEPYSHRRIGTCLSTVLIFAMVFCAVFFAASANNELFEKIKDIPKTSITVDWWQLLFFVLAIVLACYSFGYWKLSEHEPETKLYDTYLDTYLNQQNKQVEVITRDSSKQTEDGYGNSL